MTPFPPSTLFLAVLSLHDFARQRMVSTLMRYIWDAYLSRGFMGALFPLTLLSCYEHGLESNNYKCVCFIRINGNFFHSKVYIVSYISCTYCNIFFLPPLQLILLVFLRRKAAGWRRNTTLLFTISFVSDRMCAVRGAFNTVTVTYVPFYHYATGARFMATRDHKIPSTHCDTRHFPFHMKLYNSARFLIQIFVQIDVSFEQGWCARRK